MIMLMLQTTEVILTLFNPLDTLAHVTLMPREPTEDDWDTAKVSYTFLIHSEERKTNNIL